MAESSIPSQRRLELEDRRPRAVDTRTPKGPVPVSPLMLERWAILLRRHRVGYLGYEQVDHRALELARQSQRPDTSMLNSLMGRLRSLRRGGGRGGLTPPNPA